MNILLMYGFFILWMILFALSGYATYRLYEYGPYNTNLVWDLCRKVTDDLSCVVFGIAVTLFVAEVYPLEKQYVAIILIAAVGFIFARIILNILLHVIASKYAQRERERQRYSKEMHEAEMRLQEEGLYPPYPKLFSEDPYGEWERFSRAIEELRRQGKLPAVPEWMQDRH